MVQKSMQTGFPAGSITDLPWRNCQADTAAMATAMLTAYSRIRLSVKMRSSAPNISTAAIDRPDTASS